MGSLSKAPKAPAPAAAQPTVIYVPAPAPSSGGSSAPAPEENNTETPAVTPEEEGNARRVETLLRRERGRLGTILTGFRGVLGLSNDAPQRKTLLGE